MKNWLKRAIRTFMQTAIGYAAVNVPLINWNGEDDYLAKTLIGLGISAIAAGISAAMNIIDDKNNQ